MKIDKSMEEVRARHNWAGTMKDPIVEEVRAVCRKKKDTNCCRNIASNGLKLNGCQVFFIVVKDDAGPDFL